MINRREIKYKEVKDMKEREEFEMEMGQQTCNWRSLKFVYELQCLIELHFWSPLSWIYWENFVCINVGQDMMPAKLTLQKV